MTKENKVKNTHRRDCRKKQREMRTVTRHFEYHRLVSKR